MVKKQLLTESSEEAIFLATGSKSAFLKVRAGIKEIVAANCDYYAKEDSDQ